MSWGREIVFTVFNAIPNELKSFLIILILILITILVIVYAVAILNERKRLKTIEIDLKKFKFGAEFYPDGIPDLPKSNPIRQNFEKGVESFSEEKYQDTLIHLKKALEENPTNEQKAAIYNLIGLSHMTLGNLPEAEANFNRSLGCAEKLEGKAVAYGNIGIVYMTKGDLDKALEYHQKALEIEKELGRKEGMASNYGNIGVVHQTKGDLDKALENYERALTLAYEGGFSEVIKTLLPPITVIYKEQNRPEKAEEWRRKFRERYPQLSI